MDVCFTNEIENDFTFIGEVVHLLSSFFFGCRGVKEDEDNLGIHVGPKIRFKSFLSNLLGNCVRRRQEWEIRGEAKVG